MPNTFESHIIRLGGFHALSCFILAIGKLWSNGDFRDMLVDYVVCAGCTVDYMLTGKQFNRAVMGLTIVYEVPLKHFYSRCKLLYVRLIGLHNTHIGTCATLTLYTDHSGSSFQTKKLVKYVITFSLKCILEIKFLGEDIFIC